MLKKLLLLFILAGLIIGGWVYYETSVLAVEHVEILIDDLPAALDGFRIAHLSDFHGRRRYPRGIVEEIGRANVDMIATTGDYVTSRVSELDHVMPLLRQLVAIAPTYAISGNHDITAGWPEIAAQLREAGLVVLENEHHTVSRAGAHLYIAGVSDPMLGDPDLARALPAEPTTGPTILLVHSPLFFDPTFYRVGGWPIEELEQVDLTLCGHTHGGQIKIPFVGAATNATGRLFPRQHVEGLSWEGSGWLYINRGLGQSGFLRVRFLSRPELTILTLRGR